MSIIDEMDTERNRHIDEMRTAAKSLQGEHGTAANGVIDLTEALLKESDMWYARLVVMVQDVGDAVKDLRQGKTILGHDRLLGALKASRHGVKEEGEAVGKALGQATGVE